VSFALSFCISGARGGDLGSAGCKCQPTANSKNNLEYVTVNETKYLKMIVEKSSESNYTSCTQLSDYLYAEDYGVGSCEAWDEGIEPNCNGDSPPDYCSSKWCYVNETECRAANVSFAASVFTCGRFYSYETCGEEDTFSLDTPNSLRGATLRIATPNSYFSDNYRLDANGSIIYYDTDISKGRGEWRGVHPSVLDRLALEAGFTFEFVPVSGGSLLKYPGSRYTACAYDVSRGIADMCVAAVWETSARRVLTPFSIQIIQDDFYLAIPKPTNPTNLLTRSATIFQPFSLGLWGSIVACSAVVAAVYGFIDDSVRKELADFVKSPKGKRTARATIWRDVGEVTKIYLRYWYRAMYELTAGMVLRGEIDAMEISEGRGRHGNPGTRILSLGWSFFIVIVLASYTANLAAFLTNAGVELEISSLDDCLNQNCKLCASAYTPVLEARITQAYPKFKYQSHDGHGTTLWTQADVSTAVKRGRCDAAIVSKYELGLNPSGWHHCQVVLLPQVITSQPVAWPISYKYSKTINYHILKMVEEGTIKEIVEQWQPKNYDEDYQPSPPSYDCEGFMYDDETGSDEERGELTVSEFTGAFVVVVLAMGAGIIGSRAEEVAQTTQKEVRRRLSETRLPSMGLAESMGWTTKGHASTSMEAQEEEGKAAEESDSETESEEEEEDEKSEPAQAGGVEPLQLSDIGLKLSRMGDAHQRMQDEMAEMRAILAKLAGGADGLSEPSEPIPHLALPAADSDEDGI